MKYFPKLATRFLLLCTLSVTAQNGDSIAVKITDKEDAVRIFYPSLFHNPANYMHYRKYNLTEFQVANSTANNNISLAQQGKEQRFFSVGANAYHKQDTNKAMWGNAMYKQGKRENVQWNESADYDKIFPYVVADSVGGAINYEHYRFEGGYVQQLGTYSVGISGFYQAQMEYRKIDPRPKNISAFFGLKLGGTKTFNDKVTLGIGGSIEKYTQKHAMHFYSPIGFPTIYQLSGMGNYNSLLKGKRKEAYYEGWTYGVNVELYETQKRSWFLSGSLQHFEFEKLLPEFYDLQTSVANDIEYNASVGKLFDYRHMTFGIRLDGSIRERRGTENLFVNQSSQNYLKIGEAERYLYQHKTMRINGLWQYIPSANVYSATPFIEFGQTIEQYKNPFSETAIHHVTYGMHGQWLHPFKNKSLLSTYAGWTTTSITKDKALFSFSDSNAINQMLLDNYRFQTSDYWTGTLKLRYDFPIPGIINAFTSLEYRYQKYSTDHNDHFFGTIGISF